MANRVRLTVTKKIIGSFLCILLIMTVLGVVAISNTNTLKTQVDYITSNSIPSVTAITQIHTLINGIVVAEYRHIMAITDQERSNQEQQIQSLQSQLNDAITKYEPLIDSQVEQTAYQTFSRDWNAYLQIHELIIKNSRGHKEDVVRKLEKDNLPLQSKLQEELNQLKAINIANTTKSNEYAATIYAKGIMNVFFSIGAAIIFSIGLGYYLHRSTVRPLMRMKIVMKEIADGDLTKKLFVKSNDEFKEFTSTFNEMMGRIRTIFGEVEKNAQLVLSSAEELMANADESTKATEQLTVFTVNSAEGAEKQLASVEDMNQLTGRIKEGIQNINDSVESTTKSVSMATDYIRTGNGSVTLVGNQITTIKQSMDQTFETISRLGERSKEIGNITSLITDISNQTNLLALNASIEAVRAGSSGKGFSVVANEVKKLSEQSKQSTDNIRVMIEAIQKEIYNAISSITEGNKRVDEVLVSSHQTQQAFQKINQSIEQVLGEVATVNASVKDVGRLTKKMEEETKNVQKVAMNTSATMEETAGASEEQLAGIEEVSAASHVLTRLATDLQKLVSKFKVE